MTLAPGLLDALQFLLLELRKQLQLVDSFVHTGDIAYASASLKRRDYIDNHHIQLLSRLNQQRNEHEAGASFNDLYSYTHLSYQLRQLSVGLDDTVYHLRALKSLKRVQKKPLFDSLNLLLLAIENILPALQSVDLDLALELCRHKLTLDRYAERLFLKISRYLARSGDSRLALKANFIVQDLARISDALLHTGEAIISAKLGQPIEIQRYRSLEATINALDLNPDNLTIHPLGETKSGCTISGLRPGADDNNQIVAVIKQGDKRKINEEKHKLETWQQKFPGIAPRLYAYHLNGNQASMLYEYLPGKTLDTLLTAPTDAPLNAAFARLFKLLNQLWQHSEIDAARSAHYMRQLKNRLDDIYQVHPEFDFGSSRIGDIQQASLESLINQASHLEARLYVPPAVYIHGDFNLDNILYHAEQDSISFVDLHRSEYADYVQDLSVLMVSHYRVMNFDPEIRKRIALCMERIYQFGADYADQIGDADYSARMALGLARSFLTSTRFVLDATHAKAMHFRGRYLLEQLLREAPDLNQFHIPRALFHD
ncbi:MAG: phosphotransferase [Thiomicrospira sp.]|jgi:aminoglycoside phosphotransferase (APT) family kinase protein|nr:phosphotransferase [Thiomicrospira sp.]